MRTTHLSIILILLVILMASCNNRQQRADAYGNFEAVETVISAESNGRILMLSVNEGEVLMAGDTTGLIDTTDLHYRRLQALAQRRAVAGKATNISAQTEVYRQQKTNLITDKRRIENLLKEEAATPKQFDDVSGAIEVLDRQIETVKSQLLNLADELAVIDAQLAQIGESLKRCYIINPVSGTVLNRFAVAGEITAFGKPLYKIADLKTMDLRVYISGDMLSQVKTGQEAEVLIDTPDGPARLKGKVNWISPTAEFTPKIIQTREERVNLVYAVKLSVPNDGSLKISMPAEVNFNK
jgi:HlyD family secretion protein